MKTINCFNPTRIHTAAAWRIRLGKKGGAVLAGLLMVSLLAASCSRQSSNTGGAARNTNQEILNPPPGATSAASTIAESVIAPPAKKSAKKHPSRVKYDSDTYGVSFRYPRIYGVKSRKAIEAADIPMDFSKQGGVTAVSIDMPKGMFPDTDLAAAFFQVNVNKKMTVVECAQFGLPELDSSADQAANKMDVAEPASMALGDLQFQEVEAVTGEGTQQSETKYYHAFQNGSCYEFALGLVTDAGGDDSIKPVDRERVFRRLETILASVKIKEDQAPEVAVSAGATPGMVESAEK